MGGFGSNVAKRVRNKIGEVHEWLGHFVFLFYFYLVFHLSQPHWLLAKKLEKNGDT